MKNNYTVADVRVLIENRIEDTAFADKVAAVLKRFNGKTVTKRMATAVEKAFPTYTVFYDTSIGMRHIYVWGNEIAYDNRKSFLLSYESHSQVFSLSRFTGEYNRAHYGAAQARNEKRAAQLKDIAWQMKVVEAINAINSARNVLKDLVCYPAPDEHAIWKLVEDK